MLKKLTSRERFDQLVSTFEPMVRQAFAAAIEDITSSVVLSILVKYIEQGRLNDAIRSLNIDAAAFSPLSEAIRQAFAGGGTATVERIPPLKDLDGHRVIIRFDVRNLEAETYLRDHSSTMIRSIVADQEESIRIRLNEGLMSGDNPRRTALDIVGRLNRATGRRQGGIIGLTSQQSRYVSSAWEELRSGDPAKLNHYLTRKRRDKRFDRTIAKAIRENKPIPVQTITKMVGRYNDSLLKLRGDIIAQHETFEALNVSKLHAVQQAIDKGLDAETVVKIWHDSRDKRVRHTHRVMNGQHVGFSGKFVSPSGATLECPHDPKAPTAEILGCRCWMDIKIDHLAGLE